MLIGIVFLSFVFFYGYYVGYQHEKHKFDTFVEQTKTNAIVQKELTKQAELRQTEITNKIVKGWSDAIQKLNSYYGSHPNVKWLPNISPTIGTMSEVTKDSTGINGKAESYSISTTGINPLDCASDVLQLLTIQQWLREQGLAN